MIDSGSLVGQLYMNLWNNRPSLLLRLVIKCLVRDGYSSIHGTTLAKVIPLCLSAGM